MARCLDIALVRAGLLYPCLSQLLAVALAVLVTAYIGWKITQSGEQALQFAFNGLSVGAVYALLAMGFTLVYSTVWFFDLYYGAAAALGAYGVFYLRSQGAAYGFEANDLYVNIVFAAVTAGVTAWVLHIGLFSRLRARVAPLALRVIEGVTAAAAGVYVGFVLAYPDALNVTLSPAVGAVTAVAAGWALYRVTAGPEPAPSRRSSSRRLWAAALGAYCGFLVANAPGASLYLSWVVSCLLAGAVGLALYRGLYVYMRQRSNSPLVMLVASLGILLAITAFITIVFRSAPRPLPEAFGSDSLTIAGANIKGFNVFAIASPSLDSPGCCSSSKKPPSGRRCGPSATTKRYPRWWGSTRPS